MERENHIAFGAHGKHEAWTEGHDVVHISWHGDITLDDAHVVPTVFDLIPNASKGFFLVLHVANQGNFTRAARMKMRNDPRTTWTREVLVVGASFHVRVMLEMISKALIALRSRKTRMNFVASEAEVPAQIERMRREWADRARLQQGDE